MTTVFVTIEESAIGARGCVEYEDNLIVESARWIEALKRKFKKLLKAFHEVDPNRVKFVIARLPPTNIAYGYRCFTNGGHY
jgi:hypothetical protein